MPISHKHKIIFVHIPKNAGTTIEKNLEMVDTGHLPWDYFYRKYPAEWRDYRKVAVVRNPFDRLVSCYEYAKLEKSYWHSADGGGIYGKHPDYDICRTMDFLPLINGYLDGNVKLNHHGWPPQHAWICDGNTVMVDELIEISQVDQWFADNGMAHFQSLNRSKKDPLKRVIDYYSFRTYWRVLEKFDQDFRLWEQAMQRASRKSIVMNEAPCVGSR